MDVNKNEAVILDGKVIEKGCRRFDFYCKRTGKKLDTRNLETAADPTDAEIAISIYYEAVDALNAGDAFYAGKKFKEVENLMPQDVWASKASLMAGYSDYARNSYSAAIFTLQRHMKHYPADKNIPYAHYLIAMCYYEQILDEKKDLKPLLKAKEKFEFIVQVYPDTEKWIPALNRLKLVVKKYDKTVFVEEALHRLVEVYYRLGLLEEAKHAAAILGYNYKTGDWYKRSYKVFNKKYKSAKISKKKEMGLIRRKIKGMFE